MIKVLILEDNQSHILRLENAILDISKEKDEKITIKTISSEKEYNDEIKQKGDYDLYFLDLEIDKDKDKGFYIAKDIRSYDPYNLIVFVTTLSESMPLAFKNHISALDFIIKDSPEDVFRDRVRACLDCASNKQDISNKDLLTYSYEGRSGISIPYSDILFIQTSMNSHRLVICAKNYRQEFYGVLSDIIDLDKNHVLEKADRSTLVNIKNVSSVDKKKRELLFFDGTTCEISRLKINSIMKKLGLK